MGGLDWKAVVKTVAPTLGAALGGPLAGAATAAIGSAILGEASADEKRIKNVLNNASSETFAALSTADKAFADRMSELDIDVFELEIEDRKSARKLFGKSQWPQLSLSFVLLTIYSVVLYALFATTEPIDPGMKDVIIMMLGVLVREVASVIAFWFGSSIGSKTKDQRRTV